MQITINSKGHICNFHTFTLEKGCGNNKAIAEIVSRFGYTIMRDDRVSLTDRATLLLNSNLGGKYFAGDAEKERQRLIGKIEKVGAEATFESTY